MIGQLTQVSCPYCGREIDSISDSCKFCHKPLAWIPIRCDDNILEFQFEKKEVSHATKYKDYLHDAEFMEYLKDLLAKEMAISLRDCMAYETGSLIGGEAVIRGSLYVGRVSTLNPLVINRRHG